MTKPMLLAMLAFALTQAHAGETKVFGAAMPAGASQPIGVAIAAVDVPGAGARKFSGRITEVCQAKGCWVMLEDDGQVARVMMKDHAFSVPRDARGAAVVYGSLEVKTLDEKTARHLAEDAGAETSAPGASREYRIEAVSVELMGS